MKNKTNLLLLLITCLFAGLACTSSGKQAANNTAIVNAPPPPAREIANVKPVFDVKALMGLGQKGVDRILGTPSKTSTTPEDSKRQIREYAKGKNLSVSFYSNRIETVTFLFDSPYVHDEVSFRWCGINLKGGKPDSNTGESRLYNGFMINNKPVNIEATNTSIKFDFSK